MSASDNLQPGQFGALYHGSDAEFGVGDVIQSKSARFNGHPSLDRYAYATPHRHTAWQIAKLHTHVHQQPRLYQVEPVNHETVEPDPHALKPPGLVARVLDRDAVRSPDGFRVTAVLKTGRRKR